VSEVGRGAGASSRRQGALATGFGLRYPNDEANLSVQFEVYDALYAWCKLQVASAGSNPA